MPTESCAPTRAAKPAVLLVHNRYRVPGGEDRVFEAEAALLRQHGHRVVVYERTNAELDGHGLKKLLLPFTALFSLKTYREVRALLRREKPDLIHVHNTLTMVSPSVFFAARAEGVPAVHTLHNFRLLCPNGVFLRPENGRQMICEECPQNGLFCAVLHRCYRGSLPQSAVNAASLALHRALGTWRRVWLIAITGFDRDKFLAYNKTLHIFDENRLLLKPHAVCGAERPALPWAERENAWLFAGRLEALKGLPTLLEGWKLLGERRLLVAGDGPLEDWAREFSTTSGKNVEYLGRLDHDALLERVRRCRGVIVPSLCYESFGLAAAEALCCGTPVVGSDLGNTGAFIQEGENGVKFAPGDAAALAAAVKKLEALGPSLDPAAIQANAAARFSPEENYRALAHIYSTILSREAGVR